MLYNMNWALSTCHGMSEKAASNYLVMISENDISLGMFPLMVI